jgi:hypothetical protein
MLTVLIFALCIWKNILKDVTNVVEKKMDKTAVKNECSPFWFCSDMLVTV